MRVQVREKAETWRLRNRVVGAAVAQEWAEVAPLKGAARRRGLFLDVKEHAFDPFTGCGSPLDAVGSQ